MTLNKKLSGGYYRNTIEMAGESEGSGSSGRIDMEIAASDYSSVPTRKCINLNSDKQETLGAPLQVISLSSMPSSERRKLKSRLRSELEQIRILQKRFGFQRINGATVSSSSDILSCSNGQNGPQAENFRKPSFVTSTNGKRANNKSAKGHSSNRDATGRFEAMKLASTTSSTNIILMKQCEALLKRLMVHQYGRIFNTPVDAVKLKIPDYHTIIKNPMDLGTIKNKITSGQYSTPLEFLSDVRLTFSNAMTYNPCGNDVHIMAVSLSNYFEMRWKNIEKKLHASEQVALKVSAPENLETAKPMPPSKKRKISPTHHEIIPEPVKKLMTEEEKISLGRELESLLGEMPIHIVDFLRERSTNGKESGEDEIEIDIDDLSDDTLFSLRKLLDDHFYEKQQKQARAVPCEIELLNESGLSNSSMQHCKANDLADEEVDIGGNEPPVSSYPPIEIEKDTCHRSNKCVSSGSSSGADSGSSSESEYENAKDLSQVDQPKVRGGLGYGAELDEKTNGGDNIDRDQSLSGLDQLEHSSQQKPSSVDSDCLHDGDSVPNERQISPERLYRAAILKNRFADTILKAREKTLSQGDKGDPEKLRREREELELQRRKEKARLQAEAKAAEDARRRAEAEAAAEAKRLRELEREAARQVLMQVEKTVEINENSRSIEDLELLRAAPAENLPSSVDETSPEHSHDGLGAFKFGGGNPLEQLGLFMKADEEEEEEGEPPYVPNPVNDVEEGEID